MENWVDVKGWDNYQVSDLGNVRNKITGRILSKKLNSNDYHLVSLWKNNKEKKFLLHRLVALSFPDICGEWYEGAEVDHIDTDRHNNVATNLKWVRDRKENLNNPLTKEKLENRNLVNHPAYSKWVVKLSKNNEILHFYPSTREAERQTGTHYQGIIACCKGIRKSAGGYVWKYSA